MIVAALLSTLAVVGAPVELPSGDAARGDATSVEPPPRAPEALEAEALTPGQPAARRIAVALDRGGAIAADDLARTLRGHLADLGIDASVVDRDPRDDLGERIAWARGEAAAGAEAAIWLEPAPADDAPRVDLLLFHAGSARLYRRRLTLPEEPLERQEILGVVIRGLVSGLGAREPPADMEELAIPEPRPEPAPAPATDPAAAEDLSESPGASDGGARRRLLLGVGYAGSTFAADLPWAHGAGLELGVLGRRGLVFAGELTWALHRALTPALAGAVYADARLRLSRASVGLRLGYRASFGGRVFVEPALVVRGEAAIWWPLPDSRAQRGAGMRVGVGPAVTAGVVLGRGLALTARAGLDLWIRNLDLVATSASGSVAVARPPVAGASLLAGLQYAR